MAYSLLQLSSTQNNVQLDSMESDILVQGTQWQYRIGSLFFPQQPIIEEKGTSYTCPSSYFEALYAFDKPKHPFNEGSVSIKDFLTNSTVFAMTSSKNDDLFLSGLAINNSRSLEFNLTTPASVSDRRLVTYLEYIQICKNFIDNSAVAI